MAGWRARVRRVLNRAANLVDAPRVVLTWHRIGADGDHDPARLAVAPQRFAEQLRILAAAAPVVPLAGLRAHPGPAIAITFDDGYADNLHAAAPLLAAANLPATVFVTAGFVGGGAESWWDQLAQLLLDRPTPPRLPDGLGGGLDGLPTADAPQRRAAYDALGTALHALPPVAAGERLKQLAAWAGRAPAYRASRRFLDHGELRALAAAPGITIGAHTVRHGSLARLSAEERRVELTDGRLALERETGRPVLQLAYPYGTRHDVDHATVAAAAAAGYRVAVTTDPGQVHRWSPPLRLRRHTVRDWDGPEFAERLAGFWWRGDHGGD